MQHRLSRSLRQATYPQLLHHAQGHRPKTCNPDESLLASRNPITRLTTLDRDSSHGKSCVQSTTGIMAGSDGLGVAATISLAQRGGSAGCDGSQRRQLRLSGLGSLQFRMAAGVRVNDAPAVPLAPEAGHTDPADTTWVGSVSGAHPGDTYLYEINRGGVVGKFDDPRAQRLTGFELPDGFGLPGNDNKPRSVVVDPTGTMPAFAEPSANTIVIYELHVGTFAGTFKGVSDKLDYLRGLGINAVEVLPITQNPLFPDHTPPDHDWGYDPVQLFAIKTAYGTPADFVDFIRRCHQDGIAVIVDVVYNHLVGNNLLTGFGGFTLPQIPLGIYLYGGDRADTGFGPRPDLVDHRSDSTSSTTRCCCCETMAWTACGSTTPSIFAWSGTSKPIRKASSCSRTSISHIATPIRGSLGKSPLPRICRVQAPLPRRLRRAGSNSTVNGMTQWSMSCAT